MKTHILNHKVGSLLPLASVFACICSSLLGQQTCLVQNERPGTFSNQWICERTYPGPIGGTVNLQLDNIDFAVPAGGRADFIVPLDNGIVPNPPIQYSISATWSNPIDPNLLRFDDKGVSFLSQPEQVLVANITDTEEAAISERFSWTLDNNGMAVGLTVTDQQLSALPEQFKSIDHYHATIRGLPENELVTFSKRVSGGSVVRLEESMVNGTVFYDNFDDGSATDLSPLTYRTTRAQGEMQVVDGDIEFASPGTSSGLRMYNQEGPLLDTDGWSMRARLTVNNLHEGQSSGFGGVGMAGSGQRWAIVTLLRNGSANFSVGPNGNSIRLPEETTFNEEFVVQLDAFDNSLVGHLWRPDSPTDVTTIEVSNNLFDISPRFASGRADTTYHSVLFSTDPIPLPTGFESLGDLNGNEILDIGDLHLISRNIASGANQAQFDFNNDGAVDGNDLSQWIKDYYQTWIGDSNLDSEFNSTDFIRVFQAGKYEVDELANWSEGDWNGDQRFDSGDFIAAFQDGGYEKGTRAASVAVPEPSSWILLALGLITAIGSRRIGRSPDAGQKRTRRMIVTNEHKQ